MTKLRIYLALVLLLALSGCVSERHFARDTLWPFGNPNAPANQSENAERALGRTPDVATIPPQAGNVWPGPVQPVPTIADIEKNMNKPLGQTFVPSLPSPYPPGQAPPDSGDGPDNAIPPNATMPPEAVPPLAPGNPHGVE